MGKMLKKHPEGVIVWQDLFGHPHILSSSLNPQTVSLQLLGVLRRKAGQNTNVKIP